MKMTKRMVKMRGAFPLINYPCFIGYNIFVDP